jgi:hypothetical protein
LQTAYVLFLFRFINICSKHQYSYKTEEKGKGDKGEMGKGGEKKTVEERQKEGRKLLRGFYSRRQRNSYFVVGDQEDGRKGDPTSVCSNYRTCYSNLRRGCGGEEAWQRIHGILLACSFMKLMKRVEGYKDYLGQKVLMT